MCGLCGAFGAADHWTKGAAAATAPAGSATAERRLAAAVANDVLKHYGLRLDEWAGKFTLRSRTGKMAVVEHVGGIWSEAERLCARACDPLDPALIAAMEAGPR